MRALITGLSGQDGSYLADLLLHDGYAVHGLVRATSSRAFIPQHPALTVQTGDLSDVALLDAWVKSVQPDVLFHVGGDSFAELPTATSAAAAECFDVNVRSTLVLLESCRAYAPQCRIVLAGSAQQYLGASQSPQNEQTPPAPTSTYGVSKLASWELCRAARRRHGQHVSTAILFNHESPRRGVRFVTRKIAQAAARIAAGLDDHIVLGDVDGERDWGYAPDYCSAMISMARADVPGDYVLATGVLHSVRSFATLAFSHAGLSLEKHLRTHADPGRTPNAVPLVGDAALARAHLGFRTSVSFEEMVALMVDAERKRIAG